VEKVFKGNRILTINSLRNRPIRFSKTL